LKKSAIGVREKGREGSEMDKVKDYSQGMVEIKGEKGLKKRKNHGLGKS